MSHHPAIPNTRKTNPGTGYGSDRAVTVYVRPDGIPGGVHDPAGVPEGAGIVATVPAGQFDIFIQDRLPAILSPVPPPAV